MTVRILHVIINLTSGGAELMLQRLTAAHGKDPRFEHQVVSLMGLATVGPLLQEQGVKVTALGMKNALHLPRVFARLVATMRERKPDVVHCWMYHSDLLGGLAARLAGVKSVIWGVRIAEIGSHMGIPRSTEWIRRACAALSGKVPDAIVYVANSAREVHERLGYEPSRGVVIPNGYQVPSAADRQRLREEIDASEGALIIGSAGRFSAQKDPKTFVEAAGLLAARCPAARFAMIGRGYTAENTELQDWISNTAAAGRFHLLGERRDLQELLGGMDVFCLHSLGEGFPNVVAEAMSAGTPCVVTDVGDSARLVDGTGISVPPGDPRVLAEALEAMARLDDKARRRMGDAARARIRESYSIQAVAARYAELYEQLASGHPGRRTAGGCA